MRVVASPDLMGGGGGLRGEAGARERGEGTGVGIRGGAYEITEITSGGIPKQPGPDL